jgi:hypothetical protein
MSQGGSSTEQIGRVFITTGIVDESGGAISKHERHCMSEKVSIRLSPDEAWEFVRNGHTGIHTTLRSDGMPISLPVWFAVVDNVVYVSTRGKKLIRVRNNSMSSFLVEEGDAWKELRAVLLTGHSHVVDLDDDVINHIEEEMERKYKAFRTPKAAIPERTRAHYAKESAWVRFDADTRILSWDNRRIGVKA